MENTELEYQETLKVLIISKQQEQQERQNFFDFWKKSVALAGFKFFGNGSIGGFEKAQVKDDLRPVAFVIEDALKGMSPGESAFIASMVSFYNSNRAIDLCKTAKIISVADLTILDQQRRKVIANLLINYRGW